MTIKKLGIWLTKDNGSWLTGREGIFSTDCEFHAEAQLDALKLPKDQAMIRTFEAWIEWRHKNRQKVVTESRPLFDGVRGPVHTPPKSEFQPREGTDAWDPVPE